MIKQILCYDCIGIKMNVIRLDLLFYIAYYYTRFLLILKEIKMKTLLWVPGIAPPAQDREVSLALSL